MIDFKEEYDEAISERKRPKFWISWTWKGNFLDLFKKLFFWKK